MRPYQRRSEHASKTRVGGAPKQPLAGLGHRCLRLTPKSTSASQRLVYASDVQAFARLPSGNRGRERPAGTAPALKMTQFVTRGSTK
jgi:hypothetical protein